eukprot:6196014-Pleurochrysis_carterae.AAC.1
MDKQGKRVITETESEKVPCVYNFSEENGAKKVATSKMAKRNGCIAHTLFKDASNAKNVKSKMHEDTQRQLHKGEARP